MLKCTLKYLIFAPTCFGPPGPSSVKIHRYKLCSVVAACISGCGVCTECRAACNLVARCMTLSTHTTT